MLSRQYYNTHLQPAFDRRIMEIIMIARYQTLAIINGPGRTFHFISSSLIINKLCSDISTYACIRQYGDDSGRSLIASHRASPVEYKSHGVLTAATNLQCKRKNCKRRVVTGHHGRLFALIADSTDATVSDQCFFSSPLLWSKQINVNTELLTTIYSASKDRIFVIRQMQGDRWHIN